MRFKSITIRNFFSFGDTPQTLDLSEPGLYLILGNNEITGDSNGSGKSTTIEAITFALFGKTTKNIKLEKIVNEKIGENCVVELQFEINQIDYWIVRYRSHVKFKDGVRLYKGEKDEDHLISKANKTDTQDLIDSIIKFNYKSFINSVMMGQENVSGFLGSDVGSGKRKEIIENILQLNTISKYSWIAQQKRKILKHKMDEEGIKKTGAEALIENTKNTMKEYVASCIKQKDDAKIRIDNLTKELIKLESLNINEEWEKIRLAEKQANEIEQEQILERQYLDRIKSLNNQIDTYNSSLFEYKGFLELNNTNISKLNQEIKKLNKEVDNIQTDINETLNNPKSCPICGAETDKDIIENWVESKKIKLKDITKSINDKEDEILSQTTKIDSWKEKIKDINDQIESIDDDIKLNKDKAKSHKDKYSSITICDTLDENILEEYSDEIKKITIEIKELQDKVFIDKEYLDSLKVNGIENENNLKSIEIELKKISKDFIMYKWWEQALSTKKNSLRSWCVNNILGYFNAKIKQYIDRFFNGTLSIQIDSELNETIVVKDSDRSYGQFSGGEKRRLNLAILFALNSLAKANISTKINIMFLDEILSNNLDDIGVSIVLELLEEMKENKDTIFIIDHKSGFKDYPSFNPVLINKGKDGFSKIKKINR